MTIFQQSKAGYNRWSSIYAQQLIREDIRDLTNIKFIGDLETLYYLLASRIGSPLSIPSLSKDLKITYNTVANWLAVFERFFMTFSIGPWTRKISRAIQKERKSYLLKFQNFLQIPAVQLVLRSGGFRIYSRNDHKVLIAPAWQWLATLPW